LPPLNQAVFGWLADHGISPAGPRVEPDMTKWETELAFRLADGAAR
jgi:hypothetical protein